MNRAAVLIALTLSLAVFLTLDARTSRPSGAAAPDLPFRAFAPLLARDADPPPPPPTPTPTSDPRSPWYTSSHSSATYYYCAADPGWKNLTPTYLRSYPTEAALLAVWGGLRTKHPHPSC